MCLEEAKIKNVIKITINRNQLSMTIIIILKSLKIIGKKRVKKNETKTYRKIREHIYYMKIKFKKSLFRNNYNYNFFIKQIL